MKNVELASTTKPAIGNRASLEITTFVTGTIEAINADESVVIRLDETVRATKQADARFPDPFWIETEDA